LDVQRNVVHGGQVNIHSNCSTTADFNLHRTVRLRTR
jgi:hypothetical protein